MNSALYSGWIAHRRFAPRQHAFRYRIGLLYLDLDEQDAVLGLSGLAGSAVLRRFHFVNAITSRRTPATACT